MALLRGHGARTNMNAWPTGWRPGARARRGIRGIAGATLSPVLHPGQPVAHPQCRSAPGSAGEGGPLLDDGGRPGRRRITPPARPTTITPTPSASSKRKAVWMMRHSDRRFSRNEEMRAGLRLRADEAWADYRTALELWAGYEIAHAESGANAEPATTNSGQEHLDWLTQGMRLYRLLVALPTRYSSAYFQQIPSPR